MLHTHLHETATEVECACQGLTDQFFCHKSDQLTSPLMNFNRMGLVRHCLSLAVPLPSRLRRCLCLAEQMNSRLVAAHMTTLSADEITICGAEKVRGEAPFATAFR